MSVGVCCQWVKERTKRNGSVVYENTIREKNLQLGAFINSKYDELHIANVHHNNVEELIKLVPTLVENKIKVFRMSSNVLPLFDKTYSITSKDELLKHKFKKLGNLFLENNIRVTCHPGQFTVLSSDSPAVVENSIKELGYHAWMFDMMNLPQTPYYAINIHGGKSGRSEQLINVISQLTPEIKNRLTLENDESCYSALELEKIYQKTGIPVVWDSHHHTFNDGSLTMEEAMEISMKTWGDIKPLQHLSNTEPHLKESNFQNRRKHSFYIHYIPECQLNVMKNNLVDVEIEAKGKNLAVLKLRKDFNLDS